MVRPVLRIKVVASDGTLHVERFLIDTGADCSVFSADLLSKLQFQPQPATAGVSLQGVGGTSPYVEVNTALEFTREDGGVVRFQGLFSAFTDPTATDLSILGRDVLNHFDLILSRPRHEILLLAGNHRYHVT